MVFGGVGSVCDQAAEMAYGLKLRVQAIAIAIRVFLGGFFRGCFLAILLW